MCMCVRQRWVLRCRDRAHVSQLLRAVPRRVRLCSRYDVPAAVLTGHVQHRRYRVVQPVPRRRIWRRVSAAQRVLQWAVSCRPRLPSRHRERDRVSVHTGAVLHRGRDGVHRVSAGPIRPGCWPDHGHVQRRLHRWTLLPRWRRRSGAWCSDCRVVARASLCVRLSSCTASTGDRPRRRCRCCCVVVRHGSRVDWRTDRCLRNGGVHSRKRA